MEKLAELEKRIERIEQRNKKVEADKKWETSFVRRAILVIFTYLAIGIYFQAISVAEPWLNAIVPAAAFMLSTLTLPLIKDMWLKYAT